MKVETHNHPTAIAPFAGAATGSGGEIRDEGATGSGSKPKAGLTGFSVSNLNIPGFVQPWENAIATTASPGAHRPRAAADHAGRPDRRRGVQQRIRPARIWPAISAPSSRTSAARCAATTSRSCSPAASATSRRYTRINTRLPAGALLVQLGGPGMLIGLGGGAASSMDTGSNAEDLDFDSVQRGNAEIQRRAQEVIDRCWQLGDKQSDPVDPRRRRGRPVERAARAGAWRRARRALRAAQDAVRRARHVAEADLVQRSAGALRAGDRAGAAGRVSRRCASASAARSRWSASRRRTTNSSCTTCDFGN